MSKVGVFLEGRPYEGGAYQYKLAVIEAVSKMKHYSACVYSSSKEWKDICNDYGVASKVIKVPNWLYRFIIFGAKKFNIKESRINKLRAKSLLIGYYAKRDDVSVFLFPMPIPICKADSYKSIVTIYDIMNHYLPQFPEVSNSVISEFRYERDVVVCQNADAILVDSELGKRHVLEHYSKETKGLDERVYTLPYIAPKYIYGEEEYISTFDRYFFYPAQFWKHKNHDGLVKAVARLRDEGINVNVIFSGVEKNNLSETQELISHMKLNSQIEIKGYVSNGQMVYLYKHARGLIMPSFGGPTNIPPLEAMALGCPPLVANNFAMEEQIGEAGLAFNPASIEEMASVMKSLWEDDSLYFQLQEMCFLQSKKWNINTFSERLELIIGDIINKE